MTTKEEKRQLLIEFRKFYYKGPMYFPITDGTIDLFLSTLPDEGEKAFTKCLDCQFAACENHKKCLMNNI